MVLTQSPRWPGRRGRFGLPILVIVVATTAVVAIVGYRLPRSQPPTLVAAPPPTSSAPSVQTVPSKLPQSTQEERPHGEAGPADGWLPDGVTVFDDGYPGLSNLDAALVSALRRAARDAGGVVFYVTSGWRSPAYQEQLLDEAVSTYGSRAEAARWVATPTTSPHVTGHAVDLGHSDATTWLSRHGAAYGLCQIYRNEPWHYELRSSGGKGCPVMYADPTHDPRMHQ
jgi:zinc D-Ala-D-Ala carboxypeptidase